jgi:hypothetical protein
MNKITLLACAGLAALAAPATAQTADEKLDALNGRITVLEDVNDIVRLQNAYGYFVDKAQWAQLTELFSDDATLEIGGRGVFTGKDMVKHYMQGSFGQDGIKTGSLINHMQFQQVVDVSKDGKTGWLRGRAYVMANGGWGLPLYEDQFVKENGQWKISRLTGPFTMYAGWEGWKQNATNNTWPDKFGPPPNLPPTFVYLTYPGYFIVPFHYPNPVTGKAFIGDKGEVGAYQAPPGTPEQEAALKVGRLADGTQPIAEPPKN